MTIHNKSALFYPLLLATIINTLVFAPKPCGGARILSSVPDTSKEFIRTSCSTTTYPALCFNSLVSYASTIQTSRIQLARTALSLSLDSATSSSAAMKNISSTGGMSPRVAGAMKDCVETIRNSVDELKESMGVMVHLGGSNLGFQINSMQTWVSAALTNDDTCMDGFAANNMNGDVKTAVRSHVLNTAQLTSNALVFINALVSA